MKRIAKLVVFSLVAAAAVANAAWSAGQEPETKSDLDVQPAVEQPTVGGPSEARPIASLPEGHVRFTTEVLIVTSDWRNVSDAAGAERDLREALQDVKLDERFGQPTLDNAPQVFFTSINAYSPEKYAAFVAWLRRHEILKYRQQGDTPSEGKDKYSIDGVFKSQVRVPVEKYLRPQMNPMVLPLVETTQEWTWTIAKGDAGDVYGLQCEWSTRRKPLGAKEATVDRHTEFSTYMSFSAPPNKVVLAPNHLADSRGFSALPLLMAIVVIHTGPQRWPVAEPAQVEPKLSMPDEVILDSTTRRTDGRFTPNRSWFSGSSSSSSSETKRNGVGRSGGGARSNDETGAAANENSTENKISTFTLRYAPAAETAQLVERLLGANRPGADLRVAAEARTNQLVIFADPRTEAKVKELLETIDRAPPNAPARRAGTPAPASGPSNGPPVDGEIDRAARPTLEVLTTLALERDVQSVRTAERLRERMNADPTGEQAETRTLEGQLRREIAEAFESRQRVFAAQVADFDERLARAKQVFELRERAKEQILRRRMEELRTPESLDKLRDTARRSSTERPTAAPPSMPRNEPEATERPTESSSTSGLSAATPARVILQNQPNYYRRRLQDLNQRVQMKSDMVSRLRDSTEPVVEGRDREKDLRGWEEELQGSIDAYQFARDEWLAHVRLLELDVQEATSALEYLQGEYERSKTLHSKAVLTKSEVDKARVLVEGATTRLEQARVLVELYRKVEEPREPAKEATNVVPEPLSPAPAGPAPAGPVPPPGR
ncbi:MAG: secretin N-terminal domain-containing protein [Pirellulales bacterium]